METLKKLQRSLWDIVEKFIDDRCLTNAASLSYTTILSLVPVAAITFTLMSSYSLNDRNIEDFLFKHFIPNSKLANVIEENVKTFADNANAIGFIGFLFLIVSTISLLNTIESSFNDIWKVNASRSLFNKFIVFWGAVTIAPILIALSILATAEVRLFLTQGWMTNVPAVQSVFLRLTPFIFTWAAFFILYRVIPNTQVRLSAALIGAVVAGSMFEWAKLGFDYYLSNFAANYSKIYGALAAIPIFLFWIYLAWLIVLFGAIASYVIQYPREMDIDTEEVERRSKYENYFSLRALLLLCEYYETEKGACPVDAMEERLMVPHDLMHRVLEKLKEKGLLEFIPDSTEKILLAKPPEKILMADIFMHLSGEILETYSTPEDGTKTLLDGLFAEARDEVRKTWGRKSIRELYFESAETGPTEREEPAPQGGEAQTALPPTVSPDSTS